MLLILVLVFLNGFFVAAEFAMVKVRSSRIDTLVQDGHRRARFCFYTNNEFGRLLCRPVS